VSGYKGAEIPSKPTPSSRVGGRDSRGERGRGGVAKPEDHGGVALGEEVCFDGDRFVSVLMRALGAGHEGDGEEEGGGQGAGNRGGEEGEEDTDSDDWDDHELFDEEVDGGLGLGAGQDEWGRRDEGGGEGGGQGLDGLSIQDLMTMMDRELEKEVSLARSLSLSLSVHAWLLVVHHIYTHI
jgi:hypothetical protein